MIVFNQLRRKIRGKDPWMRLFPNSSMGSYCGSVRSASLTEFPHIDLVSIIKYA